MFTWLPLYQEIADRLLEYELRQAELIALLRRLAEQGLQVGSLDDRDAQGQRIPLAEIDPFSFFATFNWQGRKPQKRRDILSALREAWGLQSPVPEDFDGLPLGNPQQLWFFGWQPQRAPEDIARLWAFARQVYTGTRSSVDRSLFVRLLEQRSVGEVKLSMGMFWLNPREFLPGDKWMRGYMERRGVAPDVWNGEKYFHWLEKCIAAAGTDFPQLSHAAFVEHEAALSEQQPNEDEDSDDEDEEGSDSPEAERAYWMLRAGPQGEAWDDFQSSSDVAVGFERMEDFRAFPNREAMRVQINVLWPLEEGADARRSNDTLSAWQFSREMKVGDVIFLYRGLFEMLGVAEIAGDYRHDSRHVHYPHRRACRYLAKGPWRVPDHLRCPNKTLTKVTSPTRQRERLEIAGLWPLPSLVRETTEPVTRPRRYWWLNANPKIWDFRETPVGARQLFTSHNEQGNPRQKHRHFSQVAPGDLLVGYSTNPDKEVVAIGQITKGLHDSAEGAAIEIEKTEVVAQPITWAELQAVPELAHCEPILSNQGSLFALTEEEFGMIRALLDERNPARAAAERVPFTIDDALRDLFMSREQLQTILDRLLRKKALILQGPPGVGKTFVARKLAHAAMGERDDSRVTMVQFHPSYGYEDFIQGYRPDGTGLRLRSGVFYDFARRARHDPRPHFFIIDEINRGNLAKIFGELLMLLEADKRGAEFALPLTYAESLDDVFWLPENLHVIGTMNTADRSLAMVDYALRRRFAFTTLAPALDRVEFRDWLARRGAPDGLAGRIAGRIAQLNEEIRTERDLGPGFCIGHSYFCPSQAPADWEAWYREIVGSEIVPLLEEYFDRSERIEKLKATLLEP